MLRAFFVSIAIWAGAGMAPAAIVFDKPLATETVAAPSRYGGAATTIICTRYPGFVLKQQVYGAGTGGSFHIGDSGRKDCGDDVETHSYYAYGTAAGAKGRFVFVFSSERNSVSNYLYVIDGVSRKLVFSTDSEAGPEAISMLADGVVIRMRRSAALDCSIYYGAATACWTKVKAMTGLTDDMAPDCRPSYDAKRRKEAVAPAKIVERPSMVTYHGEVRIVGGRVSYAALPGPVGCKPLY